MRFSRKEPSFYVRPTIKLSWLCGAVAGLIKFSTSGVRRFKVFSRKNLNECEVKPPLSQKHRRGNEFKDVNVAILQEEMRHCSAVGSLPA